MEYTKGKWKLSQHRSGSLVITCGNKNIAETSQATRIEDAQEVLANARLIALAPEMYEALKETLDEVIQGNYGELSLRTQSLITNVLAKAKVR